MDTVKNWKTILKQWINECNFLEKAFYSIEQSEIEIFFEKFMDQIKGDVSKSKDLSSFLKEHYPLFNPHFDDEGVLSSSDYFYVYSLLLHFSCVKSPDEFFQKNCQRLNELSQQSITTFFKKLLEANSLTKETLRHAIASITSFAQPNSKILCTESPLKTPRKTEISPPTPSSFILQERQERNKELHRLKVQLDNEVYEKGILEIEVKQNQERILKLSRELKTSHQIIQDLKNDISSKNTENDSAHRQSEDEQLNRRLCKQISQKEMEIVKQQQDLDALTEEKDILNEKLSHAEKQMKIFQNNIEELTFKIDELMGELEEKDIAIQYLSESKLELEHYISEIRSSSASSRPDLNISVECLDLSRTTNSSGSLNSPENLGCSVVDVQLREKEIENTQLRKEIDLIRLDNSKLSKHMSDLTVRYSKFFDICSENLIVDQESFNPVENFMVFSNYVEKFIQKYEENCIAFNKLKEKAKTMEGQNEILSNKITGTESEVVDLKKRINDLQITANTLETDKNTLENLLTEYKNKQEMSLKERLEAAQKFENIQKDLDCLRNDFKRKDETLKNLEVEISENNIQNQKLIVQIKQINIDYEHEKTNMKNLYESDISLLNEKFKESSVALLKNEKKIQQLESEKKDYENRILDMKAESGIMEKRLMEQIDVKEQHLQEKFSLIKELEKKAQFLISELEETKQNCDYLSNEKNDVFKEAQDYKEQISYLKKALEENEQNVLRLSCDENDLKLVISDLQTDKETLINSIQQKIDLIRIAFKKHEIYLKENIHKQDEEKAEVMKKVVHTENELKLRKREYKELNEQHAEIMKKLVQKENELKSQQRECKEYKDSREFLAELKNQYIEVVYELQTRLQMITKATDSETTTNDFQEQFSMFQTTPDSKDPVNNLKRYINVLIQKLQHTTLLSVKNEEQLDKLLKSEQRLTQQNRSLENKLILSERRIGKLREDVESESQCEKNILTNEVKRLNDDINNLEKVCDRLTEENSSLQLKLSELQTVAEELNHENNLLKAKSSVLEADHSNQLSMVTKLTQTETKLRVQVVNMQASAKKLETDIEAAQKLILDKTQDIEKLLEQRNEAELTINSMKRQISDHQTKILNLECDLKRASENHVSATNIMEKHAEEQRNKIKNLKVHFEHEASEKRRIKNELENANVHLNMLKKQKIDLENEAQTTNVELEKFRNELRLTKTELIRLQCEETRLLGKIEIIKETQISSEAQVEKCNKEIAEQKENVSRLIREIASIRREKDIVEEEKMSLLKSFEEKETTCASLDANYKSIVEKLQSLERDLLSKQSLFKSEQIKSQDLENQLKKIQIENTKLKETGENNNKRMEKQALKLGETQAKVLRLKKEAEQTQNSLEILKTSTEMTQRENSKLNLECMSLKEKLVKYEKGHDQLESKLQTLEKTIEVLRIEKENIDTSENDLKSSKVILEKNKAILEDKIRKLAKSLSDSNAAISRLEHDKVQLNLEVGGLNKQLQESKSLLSVKLKEIQDVTSNLIETKNANQTLMEYNGRLQVDANEIREENSRLNDQLSKILLRLQITQEEHENIKTKFEVLRADLDIKKTEKDVIEREHQTTMARLKEVEMLTENRHSTESKFVNKVKALETELAKMSSEYCSLDEIRKQEKQNNEQLNLDISILQAKLQQSRSICEDNIKKWNEEKEQLLGEIKTSDERIKETRLELEGKLEKMKNKMKTLYNDEVTKMKKKQEREMAIIKSERDTLKALNEKYEDHTKKLSSQIFRLNEDILEHQKQNTFLKTKLKDFETKPRNFNRIPTSHAPQSLSYNLHMEDEEGEVFNNTYLSELKNGRMSELCSRDICPQELQYRNSLQPPHLKSTYLAQFDHQMGEEEIRETISLDDSLSTLLNTGQRKKVSGATSYKRPGPPTPSKNAGRLSFGGNGEFNREILKETLDMGNGPSSSKTPAKFKLFSSRLSMKDEHKNYVTAFKRKQHILGTIQCSSTPRKSKAHFDQRRLFDQIMSTASSGLEDSVQSLISPAVDLPPTLKTVELSRRTSQKWRQPKKLCATTDSGTSDVTSPMCKDITHSKRLKRFKDRRGSIYLRGSMFARNCRTPNVGFREVFKRKSKIKRNADFNKYRTEMLNELLVKKASVLVPCVAGINNRFFMDAININNNAIEGCKAINFCFHNSGVSDDVKNDKSSMKFQELLTTKESHAPFEISEINGPSYLNVNSSSNVHSRTIYGASVILNRKIPNVNTTLVRKSSIYLKANDGHGVILVTNQTITLMDMVQIWIQMNISAKIVIGLSFTTLFVAMSAVVIQLLL